MATVNLGRIKPVFRGAYNSSTAYVVDDIVTDSNETFICILASTGNATSNATYWTKLAAKGTDGTDVSTTITTQGDILYRDGSGLQRLAKPASNKFLQNTSGGVLSWESVSSDVVKIASYEATGITATDYSFTNVFDDTLYGSYKLIMFSKTTSGGASMNFKFLNGSTAIEGSTDYRWGGVQGYRRFDNSSPTVGTYADGDGRNFGEMYGWGNNATYGVSAEMFISGMTESTSHYGHWQVHTAGRDQSSPVWIWHDIQGGHLHTNDAFDGIKLIEAGGNQLGELRVQIYGYKK